MEILDAFPNAGMVSAQPNFFDVLRGDGKAHLNLQSNENFRFGEFHPSQVSIDEYCIGIGADEELTSRFQKAALPSVLNHKRNVEAVLGASHMQFIIPKKVANQLIPLPVKRALYRSEDSYLDRRIDEEGYLHLSTQENFVIHMGNKINERLLVEINELNDLSEQLPLPSTDKQNHYKKSKLFRWMSRLTRNERINHNLLRVYDFIYLVLYSD